MVPAWPRSVPRCLVLDLCCDVEVAMGPIYAIAWVVHDPQYAARDNLLPMFEPEVGEVTIPGVVPRLTATPGRVASLGPALGEANEAIYRDLLGLDEAEIAELRDKGVI